MKKIVYIFFFLMLFSPILSYFTMKYRDIEVNYYFQIGATLLGMMWFGFKFNSLKIPNFVYPLLIYILYLMIWANFNGEIDRRGWFNYLLNNINIQILFVLLIIWNMHFSEQFIKWTFLIIKITIVFAFIFSLIQLVYRPFFFTPQYVIDETYMASIYEIRRSSVFGYVDRNAYGLVFLPLVALYLSHKLINKENYALLLALSGIVAFATNTRYVMVGFIIVLILILISRKITIIHIVQWIFLGFIVSLILIEVFKLLGYDFVEFYNRRLFREGSIQGTTRFLAFQIFMKFFPEYWLYGNGLHLSTEIASAIGGRSSQIHIGYLSHLVSFGIVGSIFLFTFWFMFARELLKTARKTNYYGGFFALLVFLWANATLVYYSLFTYGLIFAFIYNQYHKQLYDEQHETAVLIENDTG